MQQGVERVWKVSGKCVNTAKKCAGFGAIHLAIDAATHEIIAAEVRLEKCGQQLLNPLSGKLLTQVSAMMRIIPRRAIIYCSENWRIEGNLSPVRS